MHHVNREDMMSEKNRKIVRRNRKPAERTIIFASVIGGLSLDQTRSLLKEAGFGDRDLPNRSWELLNSAYLPKLKENPSIIGEWIFSPPAMGDIE